MPRSGYGAVDLGAHRSGVALYAYTKGDDEDPTELVWCGLLDNDTLIEEAQVHARLSGSRVDFWVCETPQAYRRRRSTHNGVRALKEALRAIQEENPGEKFLETLPREWKGQVPKVVHNQRVLNALSHVEREKIVHNHNVIDAVGIGLWFCGRIGRKRGG